MSTPTQGRWCKRQHGRHRSLRRSPRAKLMSPPFPYTMPAGCQGNVYVGSDISDCGRWMATSAPAMGETLDSGDGVSLLQAFGSTTLSCSSARHRNSFRSSLRVNGTADIGIASQGLVAPDQQVWYPSLQQVADKTPSPPSFERTRKIRQPIASRRRRASTWKRASSKGTIIMG